MPRAHIAGLTPLPAQRSWAELHPLPGEVGGLDLDGWKMDVLSVGDLRELKEQGLGKPFRDISGTGVLKVKKRILRMQLVSDGINENKPCSGLSRLD